MSLGDPRTGKRRLIEGFRGLPRGMDGSKDPILVPKDAAYYAQNVTFRGGSGPKTRPGFLYKSLSGTGATTLKDGKLFQGWCVYNSPLSGVDDVILMAVDGNILKIIPTGNSSFDIQNLSSVNNYKMSASRPVYFCQASRFVVVQDGESDPLVFVGNESPQLKKAKDYITVRGRVKSVPIGTHMAYGQGRLFVVVKEESNKPSSIHAGDISFGGSTDMLDISSSVPDGATKQVFTTTLAHTFNVGDYVTLQAHTTLNPIDGTYEIIAVNATKTTFTVYTEAGSDGTGGYVSKFNAGTDKDILHFSEHEFINEGGALIIPAELGAIRSLTFLPVQDTAAGQGDLVAFCERGAATFAVSLDRTQWKQTQGFQRILFLNVGMVGGSVCPVNGDLYFRSMDGNGIRSYRNARAEFAGSGQTPLSSEIDPILTRDTEFLLEKDVQLQAGQQFLSVGVSLVSFDNRLLMTCLPKVQTSEVGAGQPYFTKFTGIAALDFKTVSGMGKSASSYDGVWTGIDALSLISGTFNGVRRAFAMCYHNTDHELWEVSKDGETDIGKNGKSNIVCSITTKNWDFEDSMMLKRLLRCDLWFDSISGGPTSALDISLYYRPDSSPKYIPWTTWQKCFTTQYTAGVAPIDLTTPFAKGYAPQLRSPTPPQTANDITGVPDALGYDFGIKVKWVGHGRLTRLMLHVLEAVENVGGG
jgi:hypothetical protein